MPPQTTLRTLCPRARLAHGKFPSDGDTRQIIYPARENDEVLYHRKLGNYRVMQQAEATTFRHRAVVSVLVYCAAVVLMQPSVAFGREKRELGWVENASILPENIRLSAKLDTGANTTSLGIEQLTRFERKGRPWVRFRLSDKTGKAFILERPVIRTVRVKRSQAQTRDRPVVLLTICLAGEFSDETVTLATRSHLLYPLLIGRASMEGRFLVNPSRTRTHATNCIGG